MFSPSRKGDTSKPVIALKFFFIGLENCLNGNGHGEVMFSVIMRRYRTRVSESVTCWSRYLMKTIDVTGNL